MLTRLIYASEASDALNPERVEDILSTARQKNQLHDITGLLLFDSQFFLQVLEGSRADLSQLYSALVRDTRHRRLELLSCGPISERIFSDWSMGFAGAGAALAQLLLRQTSRRRFNPYQLSPEAALAILTAVAASIAAAPVAARPSQQDMAGKPA
jgi:hypothetical protein